MYNTYSLTSSDGGRCFFSCTPEKNNDNMVINNPFSKWAGFVPKDDPYFFPIGVYTQDPVNAGKYKALGINLYMLLWEGPTAEQIAELKKHDMRVFCKFNEYAKNHLLDDPIVVGWNHMDEPDLAKFTRTSLLENQAKTKNIVKEHWPKMYEEMDLDNKDYAGWGFGYSPGYLQNHYEYIKKYDARRPIKLGLSKAVVLSTVARGDRMLNDEDYFAYANGNSSDLISFDVYPVAYGNPDKLWQIPAGIDRLNC